MVVEFHRDQAFLHRLDQLEAKSSWLCIQLGISLEEKEKEEEDIDDNDNDDDTSIEEQKRTIATSASFIYKQGKTGNSVGEVFNILSDRILHGSMSQKFQSLAHLVVSMESIHDRP